MIVWKNTKTLDGLIDGIYTTDDKASAQVALIGGSPIDLSSFPKLRGIFKCGIGMDNVPTEEARKRGIAIGFPSPSTIQVIHEETANFACHLILRSLYATAGDYPTWTKHRRTALHKRTLLVIGNGNIGSRVASRMRSFMQVATYDCQTDPLDRLEQLIPQANCVTLHIPLNTNTRSFWNRARLAAMRDNAIVVNTARGAIVDEDALYEQLKTGRLRAAFDVFWEEPYSGKLNELSESRFIRTPHVASNCNEFLNGTAADFIAFTRSIRPA